MTASLFICTHAPHLPFFRLCLKSLARHARGFIEVVVVVPACDHGAFHEFYNFRTADGVALTVRHRWEPTDKMIAHRHMNATKAMADLYCQPDVAMIAHMDADCVAIADFGPESFLLNGKIPVPYRPYSKAGDARAWQPLVQAALGRPVDRETMQTPQLAYWRETYVEARAAVERFHRMPFLEYALTYHVPEFPTLGAVALTDEQRYVAIDRDTPFFDALPRFYLQGWSHHVHNSETLPGELARMEAAIG